MAVVTRGEALGHDFWIDSTFLEQTVTAMNANKFGIKARFTHPGLSSDGMGKFLGRVKNGRVEGDVVRGDLHLSETAHDTPDGDLAGYVMNLAEEDPKAFATSIVFDHDIGAEQEFFGANSDDKGKFKSPDSKNVANYGHARLAKLYADDIVDEPAANPGGLFHRGDEIAKEADDLLSYALGLTEQPPELCSLEIDPARVAGFVSRFMARHGLKVTENQNMAQDAEKPEDKKPDTVDLGKERLAALKSKYSDPSFVLEMFESDATMAQAETEWLKRESAKKDAELASLKAENEKLKSEKPAPVKGAQPVGFSGEGSNDGKDFISQARELASEKKIPMHKAMSDLAKANPKLHADYVASCRAQ